MAKIIIITDCTESSELMICFVKESNGNRRHIKTLYEDILTSKYPMLEDDEILYEFVESYATTLARELGCEQVVWDYVE